MKKRILCLLLSLMMIVSSVAVLSSCGGDGGKTDPCANGHVNVDADGKCDVCKTTIKHSHIDENKDDKCDVCSRKMNKGDGGDEAYGPVEWADEDPIKIIFQMTHNDHGTKMPSGCLRYLAGEDENARDSIDDEVLARNIDAELYTNVDVTYNYYENVAKYNWGKCIEIMESNVKSGARDMPDIYCNFAYDMIGTSLKGTFANLKNTELDKGNYFQFLDEDYDESVDNRGYMYEYMESVTLSQQKMYVLASDYFIDLIRAFYIIPVNIQLLESVGMQVTGDLDGNQKFDIDDFYKEVWQKKWTYKKLAEYSAAVYKNEGQSSDAEDIEDVLGFTVAHDFSGSAFIYCSQITIIKKEWSDEKGDYNYEYPTDSPQLYELFSNVKTLVTSKGVYDVPQSDKSEIVAKYGSNNAIAIRTRFCDNKILFGGIILVAALENTPYQTLRDQGGFGVVPVPLYHDVAMESSENYLTGIHNTARPGGIARNTKNFSACTAFLDYQSTHSTHILNEYYDYKLQYGLTDGRTGTVEMLQYIRYNVRSAFEKSFEDAIGVYFSVSRNLWSNILETSSFEKGDQIRTDYGELREQKQGYLDTLYREYEKLP
jgi:phosphoribosyl-AMP cyclohydrolase